MAQENQKNKILKIIINLTMKNGKKTLSEQKMINLLQEMKQKTQQKPLFIIEKSLQNICIPIQYQKIPTRKGVFLYNLRTLDTIQQLKWSIRFILTYSSISATNLLHIFRKKKKKVFREKKKYIYFLKRNKFNLKKKKKSKYSFK